MWLYYLGIALGLAAVIYGIYKQKQKEKAKVKATEKKANKIEA